MKDIKDIKEWEKEIDHFLATNSSIAVTAFVVDKKQALVKLIIDLIKTESLSPIQKSNLLKRKDNEGLTLIALAKKAGSVSAQQWLNFSQQLFDIHARLNIIDSVLNKDDATYTVIKKDCDQITGRLRMKTMALVMSRCDAQGFAKDFAGDFTETLKNFDTQTAHLSTIATRQTNFLKQLDDLKKSIKLLLEDFNNMNISQQDLAIIKPKITKLGTLYDAILQKISGVEKKHSDVSQNLSRARTHYLTAAQNIANSSPSENNDMTDETITQALALMGFKRSQTTTGASNAAESSNRCPTLGEVIFATQNANINEDIFTATPPNPEVIYEALVNLSVTAPQRGKKISWEEAKAILKPHTVESIAARKAAEKAASTSSSTNSNNSTSNRSTSSTSTSSTTQASTTQASTTQAPAPQSTRSESSNSTTTNSASRSATLTKKQNKTRLDEFKEQIDSLLDSSYQPINDKRLVKLLKDLAEAKSLSPAEKFELLKHTAQNGIPRVLTMYLGIVFYFKDTATEKLIALLETVQKIWGLNAKGLQLARHLHYPYFNYDSILEQNASEEDPNTIELTKKLFEFLIEIGINNPKGFDTFILQPHMVEKFYIALCRLCLTDQAHEAAPAEQDDEATTREQTAPSAPTNRHHVVDTKGFDIYYYYKVADSGESFTDTEQKQLAAYVDLILQYILAFPEKEKKAALERCVNPETSLGKTFQSASSSDSRDRAHFELNTLTSTTTVSPKTAASQSTNSTNSNSSSIIALLTGSSNKKFVDEFKRRINSLYLSSAKHGNDKDLINLINNLSEKAKSLSTAEKFELFQSTVQYGKPNAITFYVGAALYFKDSIIKKLIELIQYVSTCEDNTLVFTLYTRYPMPHPHDYLSFMFTNLDNIPPAHLAIARDKLFSFLRELGLLQKEVNGSEDLLLTSEECNKFFIAMCRLHLSYQYSDPLAQYYISYYYKIADSEESLTEVEQHRLTSYTDLILEHILTFEDKAKQAALERCVNPVTSLGKIFLSANLLNETRLKLNYALKVATTIAPTATVAQSSSSSSSTVGTQPVVSISGTSVSTSSSSSSSNTGSSSSSTNMSTPSKLIQSLSELFRSVTAASAPSNTNSIPEEKNDIEMADWKSENMDDDEDVTSKLEKS